MLGAQFNTGYMPWASSNPMYKGFDYAGGEVKLGYEMGRVTPYLMTGVALTKGAAFAGAPDPGTFVQCAVFRPGRLSGAWAMPAPASSIRSPTS